MENRIFICKYCGKEFSVDYYLHPSRTLHFCSKSCKTKFQRQGYYNKTQLENAIKKVIKENDRYTTIDEIVNTLHISKKTLSKFRVSVLSLNRELGMKKPQSMFEYLVGVFLERIFNDIESHKTFDDCLSPKGYLLQFDFYSPSNNILIEADGAQHGNKYHIYSNDYTLECDSIKNQYAEKNNFTLIRIPYTRNVTFDYVQSYINH